jgi:general secretion pathway protein D
MKKAPFIHKVGHVVLSLLFVVQITMAQKPIDVALQKKANLLSPELSRQIALEKEELRAESGELTTEGMRALEKGEYEKAYVALTAAIEKDPRNVAAVTKLVRVNAILYDTYAGYARGRMAVGDYEQAIVNFRKSLEHKPNGEEALNGLRDARQAIAESVSQNLGKLITESMSDDDKVALLIKQARDLEVQSRYEEAKAHYREALAIESEDPRPRRLLKDLIEKQGRIIADDRRIERRKIMEDLIKSFFENPDDVVDTTEVTAGTDEQSPAAQRRANVLEQARKKIPTLSFADAQIQEVISYISDVSGIDVVLNLGDKPTEPVSMTFITPISVLDAIKYVCESNPGLTFTVDEYAIIISRGAGDMETRIWTVSQQAMTSASEEKAATEEAAGAGDFDLFAEDTTPKEDEFAATSTDPEIVRLIKDYVGKDNWPDGTSVFLEPTTGTLSIRQFRGTLDQIDEYIKDLEKSSHMPQVEIQARFVEVSDQDLEEFSMGIRLKDSWKILNTGDSLDRAALLNPTDLTGALRRYAKGERSSRYAERLNSLVSMVGTKAGNNEITDEIFGFFTSALTEPEVGLVFYAMSNKTNADILSAPSVTTVSGQSKVKIRQIVQVMYPDDYTVYKPAKVYQANADLLQSDVAGVYQGYATTQGYKMEEVGIELIVSPTISEDGRMVDMDISAKVSTELEPRPVVCYTGDNSIFPALDPIILRIPRFKNSEVTTQVVVNDGETIVLGGMITEANREYHDKVPFFGDLPLVGRFFRSDGSFQDKKNLLIFVTTRVIMPTGELYKDVREREMKKAAEQQENAPIEEAAASDDAGDGTAAAATDAAPAETPAATDAAPAETPADAPAAESSDDPFASGSAG